jgi:hypothetical protein
MHLLSNFLTCFTSWTCITWWTYTKKSTISINRLAGSSIHARITLTCISNFTSTSWITWWTYTLIPNIYISRSTCSPIHARLRSTRITWSKRKRYERKTCTTVNNYINNILRSSQRWPLNPGGHWQVNPPKFVDMHAPPFKHGFGTQASSKKYINEDYSTE